MAGEPAAWKHCIIFDAAHDTPLAEIEGMRPHGARLSSVVQIELDETVGVVGEGADDSSDKPDHQPQHVLLGLPRTRPSTRKALATASGVEAASQAHSRAKVPAATGSGEADQRFLWHFDSEAEREAALEQMKLQGGMSIGHVVAQPSRYDNPSGRTLSNVLTTAAEFGQPLRSLRIQDFLDWVQQGEAGIRSTWVRQDSQQVLATDALMELSSRLEEVLDLAAAAAAADSQRQRGVTVAPPASHLKASDSFLSAHGAEQGPPSNLKIIRAHSAPVPQSDSLSVTSSRSGQESPVGGASTPRLQARAHRRPAKDLGAVQATGTPHVAELSNPTTPGLPYSLALTQGTDISPVPSPIAPHARSRSVSSGKGFPPKPAASSRLVSAPAAHAVPPPPAHALPYLPSLHPVLHTALKGGPGFQGRHHHVFSRRQLPSLGRSAAAGRPSKPRGRKAAVAPGGCPKGIMFRGRYLVDAWSLDRARSTLAANAAERARQAAWTQSSLSQGSVGSVSLPVELTGPLQHHPLPTGMVDGWCRVLGLSPILPIPDGVGAQSATASRSRITGQTAPSSFHLRAWDVEVGKEVVLKVHTHKGPHTRERQALQAVGSTGPSAAVVPGYLDSFVLCLETNAMTREHLDKTVQNLLQQAKLEAAAQPRQRADSASTAPGSPELRPMSPQLRPASLERGVSQDSRLSDLVDESGGLQAGVGHQTVWVPVHLHGPRDLAKFMPSAPLSGPGSAPVDPPPLAGWSGLDRPPDPQLDVGQRFLLTRTEEQYMPALCHVLVMQAGDVGGCMELLPPLPPNDTGGIKLRHRAAYAAMYAVNTLHAAGLVHTNITPQHLVRFSTRTGGLRQRVHLAHPVAGRVGRMEDGGSLQAVADNLTLALGTMTAVEADQARDANKYEEVSWRLVGLAHAVPIGEVFQPQWASITAGWASPEVAAVTLATMSSRVQGPGMSSRLAAAVQQWLVGNTHLGCGSGASEGSGAGAEEEPGGFHFVRMPTPPHSGRATLAVDSFMLGLTLRKMMLGLDFPWAARTQHTLARAAQWQGRQQAYPALEEPSSFESEPQGLLADVKRDLELRDDSGRASIPAMWHEAPRVFSSDPMMRSLLSNTPVYVPQPQCLRLHQELLRPAASYTSTYMWVAASDVAHQALPCADAWVVEWHSQPSPDQDLYAALLLRSICFAASLDVLPRASELEQLLALPHLDQGSQRSDVGGLGIRSSSSDLLAVGPLKPIHLESPQGSGKSSPLGRSSSAPVLAGGSLAGLGAALSAHAHTGTGAATGLDAEMVEFLELLTPLLSRDPASRGIRLAADGMYDQLVSSQTRTVEVLAILSNPSFVQRALVAPISPASYPTAEAEADADDPTAGGDGEPTAAPGRAAGYTKRQQKQTEIRSLMMSNQLGEMQQYCSLFPLGVARTVSGDWRGVQRELLTKGQAPTVVSFSGHGNLQRGLTPHTRTASTVSGTLLFTMSADEQHSFGQVQWAGGRDAKAVLAADFAELIARHNREQPPDGTLVECVVLCACNSWPVAKEIVALCPDVVVVAWVGLVHDNAAIAFSAHFNYELSLGLDDRKVHPVPAAAAFGGSSRGGKSGSSVAPMPSGVARTSQQRRDRHPADLQRYMSQLRGGGAWLAQHQASGFSSPALQSTKAPDGVLAMAPLSLDGAAEARPPQQPQPVTEAQLSAYSEVLCLGSLGGKCTTGEEAALDARLLQQEMPGADALPAQQELFGKAFRVGVRGVLHQGYTLGEVDPAATQQPKRSFLAECDAPLARFNVVRNQESFDKVHCHGVPVLVHRGNIRRVEAILEARWRAMAQAREVARAAPNAAAGTYMTPQRASTLGHHLLGGGQNALLPGDAQPRGGTSAGPRRGLLR